MRTREINEQEATRFIRDPTIVVATLKHLLSFFHHLVLAVAAAEEVEIAIHVVDKFDEIFALENGASSDKCETRSEHHRAGDNKRRLGVLKTMS